MSNAHLVAAFIGVVLSASIIILTRKDQISPLVALRWLVLALMILFVSIFPSLVDVIGGRLGIGYPPIIPVLIAIGALMVKVLLMDIERQRMLTKLNRTVQRLAMLEHRLQQFEQVACTPSEADVSLNKGTR